MQHSDSDRTQAPERYLLGEMSAFERDEFEEHLFSCAECAESVKTGAAFVENARAVFREGAVRCRTEQAKERVGKTVPWWKRYRFPVLAPTFAVLALGCLAGYQRFVLIPDLRSQLAQAIEPQPLLSFALHAASRGEPTVIDLPTRGRFVSIYFDVATLSPSGYSCEIRSTTGSVRLAIQVPQPKPGEAVNLLIERSQLPAGDYLLIVRAALPDTREIGQYSFRVEHN